RATRPRNSTAAKAAPTKASVKPTSKPRPALAPTGSTATLATSAGARAASSRRAAPPSKAAVGNLEAETPRASRYSPRLRELVEIGRAVLGIDDLRPGQAEALEHILAGRDVLAVMPTGSGKSLLYQLPSLSFPGITVVVSPLIALIKDQLDKMKALGVAVCRVDSTLTVKQKREMETLVRAPGGKLLLTTPER